MNATTPLTALESFLGERIEAGDFPGALFAIDGKQGLIARGALGARAIVPAVEPATMDTLYDLASLTKPLVTAAIASLLARQGRLRIDEPAGGRLEELAGTGKEGLTLRQLATHTSGLPAWLPLYLTGGGIAGALAAIAGARLETPPGKRATYSCCGYILLGEVVARAGGEPLDALFRGLIADPLGLSTIGFRPPVSLRSRIAPTERDCGTERAMVRELGLRYDGWRHGVIRGEVHDGNAWGLGGVAGNAGLFGTASDLVLLGRELEGRGSGLFEERERQLFATPEPCEGEVRSFGWQLAATAGSAAHGALGAEAYGHTGFTGTSMWIDPSTGGTYILLTNRIHPDNRQTDMNAIRREFHTLARRVS